MDAMTRGRTEEEGRAIAHRVAGLNLSDSQIRLLRKMAEAGGGGVVVRGPERRSAGILQDKGLTEPVRCSVTTAILTDLGRATAADVLVVYRAELERWSRGAHG